MSNYGILPSFAGGELSEAMYGRVDMAKYSVGLALALNSFVHAYGGVSNRPGTEYLADVKDHSKKVRLVPFQYSTEQAYILEFGHNYIRVYKDGYQVLSAGNPVEIATPYTESMLEGLSFVQSADILFICHSDIRPKMLSRYSHISWTFTDFDFIRGPFMDVNTGDVTITPSAVTGDITLTSSEDLFVAGDVGSLIKIGANVAGISSVGIPNPSAWDNETAYNINDFVTYDGKWWRCLAHIMVGADPNDPPSAGTTWEVTSAATNIEITAFKSWYLETTGYWRGTIALERYDEDSASWKQVRTYASAASADTSDSIGAKNFNDSGSVITPTKFRITSSSFVQVTPGDYPSSKGYISLIATGGEFYGMAKITGVTNPKLATATVLAKTRLPEAAATKLWAKGAWSTAHGWPMSVGFFNQRMAFGATKTQPQTLWFSKPDAYTDFETTIPTADDDSIVITLAANDVNTIRHIIGLGDLVVFTANSAWMVAPGQNPFTPSNAPARVQEYHGSAAVPPVVVGNIILYLQEKCKSVRNMGYVLESDGYRGTDVSLLASHLFEDHTIKAMALQRSPYSILWCVRDDGVLLGLTYLPEHDVMAWHRHVTDGEFESVAVISGDGQDDVYFVVKRTVNGATKRYVEMLSHRLPENDLKQAVFLDSSLSYHDTTAIQDVTGLDHLEGKTVNALADGFVIRGLTVESGSVHLPDTAKDICIGLPYTSAIKTLRLEIGTKSGTLQGRYKAINKIILRVEKTLGGRIGYDEYGNLDEPKFRSDEPYGVHSKLRTGDIEMVFPAGYNKDGQIYFVQDEPLPFTIQALIPNITVGG